MTVNLKWVLFLLGVACWFIASVPKVAGAVPGLNFLYLGLAFVAAGELLT